MIRTLASGGGGVAGLAILVTIGLLLLSAPAVALWSLPPYRAARRRSPAEYVDPEEHFSEIEDLPEIPSPAEQEQAARQLALGMAGSAPIKRLLVVAVGAAGYSMLVFAYRGSEDLGGFLGGTAFPITLILLTTVFAYASPEIIDCRGSRAGRYTTEKARIAIRARVAQKAQWLRFERQQRNHRDQATSKDADDKEGY